MENKICATCKTEKPFYEFSKLTKSKDGHKYSCKECMKAEYQKNKEAYSANSKKYYQENKDRIKAANKEYYETNKEACFVRNKEYIKKHPEQKKATCKRWQQNNPEKVNEAAKRWQRANPEKARANDRNNRARRAKAYGKHYKQDIDFLFNIQAGRCLCCNKKLNREIKNGYQVDHIIPISKCGKNDILNLQLLCPKCNRTKYDQIIDYRQYDDVIKIQNYFKKAKVKKVKYQRGLFTC